MLDFEKLANMMEIRVASAHLTIKDRRTGETFVMDFYRPSSKFPLDAVSEELEKFGYEVVTWALPDPPKALIDWSVVYHAINRIDLSVPPVEERCVMEEP